MKDLYKDSRARLSNNMDNGDVLVLFSGISPQRSADTNYQFSVNRNFYYLTGLDRENFALAITKYNDTVKTTLFIEKPNFDVEKWYGRKLKVETAKEISAIEDVQFIDGFDSWLHRQIGAGHVDRVWFDLHRQSPTSIPTHAERYAKGFLEKYPAIKIQNVHTMLRDLRVIKSDAEIDMIKKAISITKEGLESVMSAIKPDIYEYQAVAHFDFVLASHGVKENAFNTIAASGDNAVILHYEENDHKIPDNSLVLFDLGASYEYYTSDISRTYPANGKFTERQKELYNIVLKAQQATIDAMKPGVPFVELNKVCSKVLADELIAIGLIKEASELSKYYYHGVSHYMGLDVHDVGSREAELQPGMVLTVEPGLYVAEEGIGIRIEDDILITKFGNENLSESIIKSVEDIENFMA